MGVYGQSGGAPAIEWDRRPGGPEIPAVGTVAEWAGVGKVEWAWAAGAQGGWAQRKSSSLPPKPSDTSDLLWANRGNGAKAGRGVSSLDGGVKVSSPEACSSHLTFPSPPSCRSINHVSRLPFYSKPSSSSLIIVLAPLLFIFDLI